MADILYEISGGFFDSVNQDRTYSAEQMNMPYKRIVTDGVFPDKNGSGSDDFIVRPDGGMYVSVNTGNALVGGKWAELDSVTVLHVPSNTSANGRIDSIILRADTSASVRAVCIVYRQGTEAASPAAPGLESNENVTELRLADIAVGAGVSTITAANITDQRGSAECPWVAGAIPPTQAQVSTAVEEYLEENPGIFIIDEEFSETSGNAVANKTVTAAISGIQTDITGLNDSLTAQGTAIGDLSELETEDKTSIVGAVNELKQSGGGDMSTLIGAELLEAENAFKEVEWVNGYFDATGTIKYSTTWKHVETFFPVRLIKYIRSFSLSINSCAGFVFYADDKETVISTVTKGTYDTATLTIVPDIPDGAEWFRCSQYITETKSRLFTVYALEDFIKEEVSRKIGLPVDWSTAMVTSGGIATDGTDYANSNWQTSDYIEVFPGMTLIYTGAGNVGGNKTLCPLAFYDENKVALKVIKPKDAPYWSKWGADWTASADSGTIISAGYITVPAKAKYVRVSGYYSAPPFLDIYRNDAWMGKKCAFFGDSITAGIGVASGTAKYSDALRLAVGITSANYAVNGSILVDNGWDRLSACLSDHANDLPDAFIFAYGTNDWGNSKPIGDWYTTDASGTRTLTGDTTTFRGALVRILTLLRTTYEDKKVILMTPIHRGPGSYASDFTRNGQGLYLEDYCEVIREAGKIFGVPVIDLYHDSGLVPDINPDTPYFSGTDRLHPNADGHALITTAIAKALERIPI